MNKTKFFENIYLLYLGVVSFLLVLITTAFDYSSFSRVIYLAVYFLGILVLGKIAIEWGEAWNYKDILLGLLIVAGFIPGAVNNDSPIILFYAIAIIGAKNIDYRKIIKIILVIVSLLFIITVTSSLIGIIPNIATYRYEGAKPRYAFGFLYTTYFSAYITAICSMWVFIRKEKLSWAELLAMLCADILGYYFTNARINFLTLTIILLFSILVKFKVIRSFIVNLIEVKFVRLILIFSSAIMALLSIILGVLYDDSSEMWQKISSLSSGRIGINSLTLQRYPVAFWGHKVTLHCDVYDGQDLLPKFYYIINNSYMEFWALLGVAGLVSAVIIWCVVTKRLVYKKHYWGLTVLCAYTILFFFEQRMPDLNINPFFLLLFSFVSTGDEKECFFDKFRIGIKRGLTVLVISILIEVFAFNFESILTLGNYGLGPEDIIVTTENLYYFEDNDTFLSDGHPIIYVGSLRDKSDFESIMLELSIYTIDENRNYRFIDNLKYDIDISTYVDGEYSYYKSISVDSDNRSSLYTKLDLEDNVRILKMELNLPEQYQLDINGVNVNGPKPFSINFTHIICCMAITALLYLLILKTKEKNKNAS